MVANFRMGRSRSGWRWIWPLAIAFSQIVVPLALTPHVTAQEDHSPADTFAPEGMIQVWDCLASTDRTQTDLSYFITFCEPAAAGVTFILTVATTGETRDLTTNEDGHAQISAVSAAAFSLGEDPIPEGYWEPFVECNPPGTPSEVHNHTVDIDQSESQYFDCLWFRIRRRSEEPGGQPCVGLDPPPGQVYLFAGRNFTSNCEAFLSGDSNLGDNDVGVGDNLGSSIKVGEGVRVMLCDKADYGGACSVLVASASFDCGPTTSPAHAGSYASLSCTNIGDDRSTSIKVIPYTDCADADPEDNEVILFSSSDYAGACLFLGMGVRIGNLRGTVLGDDGARSVRVGSAAGAILCAEADLNRCDVVTTNAQALNLGAAARGRALSAATLPRAAD